MATSKKKPRKKTGKKAKKSPKPKSPKASTRSASSSPKGLGGPYDYDNLESLLEMMKKHGISHYEWESSGQRLALSTGGSSNTSIQYATPSLAAPAPVEKMSNGSGAVVAKDSGLTGNQKEILSPFVGTFYRSASPTTDAFVLEGKTICQGDTLCIVEAMKLMNEIEAEVSGKIVKILVENEQPVEFGEPLFIVDVSS